MVSRRRGHGEGSIFKRASDGLWVGYVTVGREGDKTVRKYVTSRTRGAVQEQLRSLQASYGAGLPFITQRETVGEFLERWLRDVAPGFAPSINTLDNYDWAIRRHLIPALGPRPLVKLAPGEVVDMLREKVADGMARNTILRLRSVLAMALDHALLEGLIGRNVASIVRAPRGGSVPQGRSLDHNEALALLAQAKGTRLEAAFVLMLMVGLRPGEALGLMWTDFDPDAGTLRIERSLKRERGQLRLGDTKTHKSRRAIALPAAVVTALGKHRRRQARERLKAGTEWQDLGLIFPTSVGSLLDPSNFRREFSRICKDAGLGHWHPHELRHSAVSLLSASGVSIERVADVMGHSTTRTTETVYRHSVLPTASGAVEAMDSMFPKY